MNRRIEFNSQTARLIHMAYRHNAVQCKGRIVNCSRVVISFWSYLSMIIRLISIWFDVHVDICSTRWTSCSCMTRKPDPEVRTYLMHMRILQEIDNDNFQDNWCCVILLRKGNFVKTRLVESCLLYASKYLNHLMIQGYILSIIHIV